jgi:hypothetical protein
MSFDDDFTLENVDPEDIGDVLVKLEKSFGIKFRDEAFREAKTFGDICDVIESHLELPHKEDCTSQQAFYKVRKAIGHTLRVDERTITPATRLNELFPRRNRRRGLRKLQRALGIEFNILDMKDWLMWLIFSGFILSLIALFVDWRIGVSGFVFFYIFARIASLFSKEMEIQTVREFTEKIARENYAAVRCNKGTVNRKEISKTIQGTFGADLGLDKSVLTRDASIVW